MKGCRIVILSNSLKMNKRGGYEMSGGKSKVFTELLFDKIGNFAG